MQAGRNPVSAMRLTVGKIAAALLFVIGLCVLSLPLVSSWTYQQSMLAEADRYTTTVGGLSSEECAQVWNDAAAYNEGLAERLSQFSSSDEVLADAVQYLNPLGTGQMGWITIPKIDVKIPIYQGTGERELQAGAGWWPGTSLPTGGASTHCVLAAHSGLVKAKMFTDLDKLSTGDTFSLTVLDRVLTYEVDQIAVVDPDDVSKLGIVEGEDLVTLYTCTPYGLNTQRLLVRGHRIATPEVAPTQDLPWWAVVIVALAVVGAVGAGRRLALRSRARSMRGTQKEIAERNDDLKGCERV